VAWVSSWCSKLELKICSWFVFHIFFLFLQVFRNMICRCVKDVKASAVFLYLYLVGFLEFIGVLLFMLCYSGL
jgi:hypothetical protein